MLIVLPFLGAQSFLVRERIRSCIRNHLPYYSLRIAFQSKTSFSSLFCFKDIIPKEISSHLIHEFMCSCCYATYYGESDRHFFLRAYEHLGMTPLAEKGVKTPKKPFCWLVMTPVLKPLRFSWKKTKNSNYA